MSESCRHANDFARLPPDTRLMPPYSIGTTLFSLRLENIREVTTRILLMPPARR